MSHYPLYDLEELHSELMGVLYDLCQSATDLVQDQDDESGMRQDMARLASDYETLHDLATDIFSSRLQVAMANERTKRYHETCEAEADFLKSSY